MVMGKPMVNLKVLASSLMVGCSGQEVVLASLLRRGKGLDMVDNKQWIENVARTAREVIPT